MGNPSKKGRVGEGGKGPKTEHKDAVLRGHAKQHFTQGRTLQFALDQKS